MTSRPRYRIALAALVAAGAIVCGQAAVAQAPTSPSPPLPAEPSVPLPPPANTKPGLLSVGGALDSGTPDIVMTLRAGVQVSPSYLGSDEY